VTVFLPTLDGGERLERVLAAVKSQRTEREVRLRASDSGSRDGTAEVLARHGVRFERIDKRDYDHGLTRNRGVLESDTELVALLSQDALPANENWLESLLAPFDDPFVAGAWSRQVAQPHCHPFQRINLVAHMAAAARKPVLQPLSLDAWAALTPAQRVELLVFDNVSSAVRRSVVERLPFPRSMFGEDIEWARRALLSGYRLVFADQAVVEHSHDVNFAEFHTRVVLTHAVRRRLADHVPLGSLNDVYVRIGQTIEAFRRAAREATDLELAQREACEQDAYRWARLQVAGIFRGSRQATYQPPQTSELAPLEAESAASSS
jgi:rhamnosyltransferase